MTKAVPSEQIAVALAPPVSSSLVDEVETALAIGCSQLKKCTSVCRNGANRQHHIGSNTNCLEYSSGQRVILLAISEANSF